MLHPLKKMIMLAAVSLTLGLVGGSAANAGVASPVPAVEGSSAVNVHYTRYRHSHRNRRHLRVRRCYRRHYCYRPIRHCSRFLRLYRMTGKRHFLIRYKRCRYRRYR